MSILLGPILSMVLFSPLPRMSCVFLCMGNPAMGVPSLGPELESYVLSWAREEEIQSWRAGPWAGSKGTWGEEAKVRVKALKAGEEGPLPLLGA